MNEEDLIRAAHYWNDQAGRGSLEEDEAMRLMDIDGCKWQSKEYMQMAMEMKRSRNVE